MSKKVIIIGGVAGGANAATRLRRLDESAQITVFERGSFVSFANCGLPYHIGDEIKERSKLLQHTPGTLKARFNLDVRTRCSVERIDRSAKEVEVHELDTGRTYREPYDYIVLSPGAAPFKPAVTGLDLAGVFTLRDIPDMDRILAWISAHGCSKAAIAGGGFIGLEMLEQLHQRGITCAIFESNPQILTPLDAEMVRPIEEEIRDKGIAIRFSDPVSGITQDPSGCLEIVTKSGATHRSDIVIWSIGVRPETKLAVDAGLELGISGGVKVNQYLQTTDPAIYAVGDCIEVSHGVTGTPAFIPLAGPANRQGRIAADNIAGLSSQYRATFGTAIVRVFSQTAACTGANEKLLTKANVPYQALHLHPSSHASYYPGAHPLALKVIYHAESGTLLGAQCVGREGVDKRIDVLAVAIQAQLKVEDLIDLELCYAPPFSSAKDPVNLAGMIGDNIRNERVVLAQWGEIEGLIHRKDIQLIDVRDPGEVAKGGISGAINIPLNELRSRLNELPKSKELIVFCQSGQRSYNACRILMQSGFRCRNLSGAYKTWRAATGA
jgi:NADPH-dependent 2,4-dienoyl-CoA reductase/sulfur reductase-like enzyme/rhodanese-related sulfurtransferase